MAACKAEATRQEWEVCVAIVDDGGFLMHFERLDGAKLHVIDNGIMKARTAALSGLSTKILQDMVDKTPSMLATPGRLARQGGLPIMFGGECIGGIGVSGASPPDDERVAAVGLTAL
jgi:glc operon protein GlcG